MAPVWGRAKSGVQVFSSLPPPFPSILQQHPWKDPRVPQVHPEVAPTPSLQRCLPARAGWVWAPGVSVCDAGGWQRPLGAGVAGAGRVWPPAAPGPCRPDAIPCLQNTSSTSPGMSWGSVTPPCIRDQPGPWVAAWPRNRGAWGPWAQPRDAAWGSARGCGKLTSGLTLLWDFRPPGEPRLRRPLGQGSGGGCRSRRCVSGTGWRSACRGTAAASRSRQRGECRGPPKRPVWCKRASPGSRRGGSTQPSHAKTPLGCGCLGFLPPKKCQEKAPHLPPPSTVPSVCSPAEGGAGGF